MSTPIRGDILTKLRKLKGWKQVDLARKAKINKDTVSRLERGEQTGAGRAGKALAEALGVSRDVLTGEARMPPPTGEDVETWNGSSYPVPTRIEGAVRNSFELVALRYQIPIGTVVQLAPLLFVLEAERSLQWRRTNLSNLKAKLDEADGIAGTFEHLPTTFLPSHALSEALGAEAKSINACDLFATEVEDDSLWDCQTYRDDYDRDKHNPFARYLREEAQRLEAGTVDRVHEFISEFVVCRAEASRIALNDDGLANKILRGDMLLHEMPAALLPNDAREERLAWLRQKSAEHEERQWKFWDELGLNDPPAPANAAGDTP